MYIHQVLQSNKILRRPTRFNRLNYYHHLERKIKMMRSLSHTINPFLLVSKFIPSELKRILITM